MCFCECAEDDCFTKKCAAEVLPQPPANGLLATPCLGGKCMPGVAATYSCAKGFVIKVSGVTPPSGAHSVTCGDEGAWQGQLEDVECVPSPEGFVLGPKGWSCDQACGQYSLTCEVRLFCGYVWISSAYMF